MSGKVIPRSYDKHVMQSWRQKGGSKPVNAIYKYEVQVQ